LDLCFFILQFVAGFLIFLSQLDFGITSSALSILNTDRDVQWTYCYFYSFIFDIHF